MTTHNLDAQAQLRTWRIHVAVLLAYTLGALLLTWPLARHFATHVTGDGIDDPALAWNLWWIKARLIDQLQPAIFQMGWMFHPIQINLAFYTLTPLNGLLSIPLQVAFGLVPAVNLLVIASFVLGGYGAYLLTRSVLAPVATKPGGLPLHAAAFAAGFLYAFAAPKLFYAALGQYNIMSSQWLPFCALYVVALLRAHSQPAALRAGALAALFLLLQAWTELTFASFLLLFVALAVVAALVIVVRDRKRLAPLAAGFALMGALFGAGMLPYLIAMLPDMAREGDFFGSGGGFADLYSADLAGFLFPTRLHPWVGEWVATLPFPNDKGQQIFLGYVALLLAIPGFVWLWKRARGQALFWGAATLGFWALSLGPSLRWMGRDLAIPGPFALVSLLPFFNGNRYPSRFGVPLLLCAGVLMAAGLLAVLQRRRTERARAWIAAGVVALITLEAISIPLPLSNFHVPAIYQTLAQEPGDGALLELPTGWRNGARVLGRSDILIMMQQWRQTAHAKPRLGGNTSRNPPQKFQYYTEHPLLGDLITLMNSDQPGLEGISGEVDALIARHKPVAAQELADLGVSWLTLHEEKATAPLVRFVEQALPLELVETHTEPDWSGAPETIRLYRVLPAPAASVPRTFALAGPEAGDSAFAFLGEGWSAARNANNRYANRIRATLLLPLPDAGGTLTLSPAAAGAPPQVRVAGVTLENLPPTTAGNAYILPPGVASAPVDMVEVRYGSDGAPVHSLATEAAPIGGTGVTLPPGVALFARSAGEPTGNFAQLWVNGVNVAPGTRGFNLAALDATGALLDAAAFDTFANEDESARMAAWLRGWPAGTLIMGAVADEASYHLTQDAINALGGVGPAPEGLDHFRRSHAFIGVAGAPPGSALVAQSDSRSASVWLGAPVDGARAFGPLNEVHVQ